MFNSIFNDFYADEERQGFLSELRDANDCKEIPDDSVQYLANEDDFIVNRRDPELRNKYNYYNDVDMPEEDNNILEVAVAVGIIGGILDENAPVPAQQKISMKQALIAAKEQTPVLRRKSVKRVLSPFEQWVDDVLSGKKLYSDEL